MWNVGTKCQACTRSSPWPKVLLCPQALFCSWREKKTREISASALILFSQSATHSNLKWFTALLRFSSNPEPPASILPTTRCCVALSTARDPLAQSAVKASDKPTYED